MKFYTIGVYGSDEQEYFGKLTDNNIDLFCDIRQRRGVRGATYSFVNSKKLQDKLNELGISYKHILDLAAPDELRKMQLAEDKKEGAGQRSRKELSGKFITTYEKDILDNFDFATFLDELKKTGAENVVLFCVEANPEACHRSIVAARLKNEYGYEVIDL